jgi:hypothetical protein
MTTKIIWRLKELPTSEMLRNLVKDGLLSKEEAREILFSSQEQNERDVESFKQEIKFLRELVDKMANNQKVVEIIREIERPYHVYPWYTPYQYYCGGSTTTTSTDSNQYLCVDSLTGPSNQVNITVSKNFSDIKTF